MKYICKGQGQYYIILKTSLLNKCVNISNKYYEILLSLGTAMGQLTLPRGRAGVHAMSHVIPDSQFHLKWSGNKCQLLVM